MIINFFFGSANFPPTLTGDVVFRVTIGQLSQYVFSVVDSGDTFSVGVLGGSPVSSNLINQGEGVFVFEWMLQEQTNVSLTFFAKDSLNATATLSPKVEFCVCANGGECTLEGLLSTDASIVVMNCLCTKGNFTAFTFFYWPHLQKIHIYVYSI